MKKLNLPLLLTLIIGSMVAVVGIHFLHRYQVSRSVENLLKRADAAAESGDVDEQMKILSRYLRHRGDDVDSLKRLLKLSREKAFNAESPSAVAIRRVLGSLETAIRNHPEDPDLRREGYQAFLAVGRFSDALDHLEELQNIDSAQGGNILTDEDRIQHARIQWLNGKKDEGKQELAEMVGFDLEAQTFDVEAAKAPKAIGAYTMLAGMFKQEEDDADEITLPRKIMDQCVSENSEEVDAYLARAVFLQRNVEGEQGKRESEADVRKALELSPDDQRTILVAASTAMALRQFDWAEELLLRGIEVHPDSSAMYARLADARKAQGDNSGAMEWVNKGLEKFQLNGDLLFKRASYEIDAGDIQAAEQTIDRLSGKEYDRPRVELLRARVEMKNKDLHAARVRLERLRPVVAADDLLDGICREYLNDVYRLLGMFDKIAEGRREGSDDNLQIQYSKAEAMAALGDFDGALQIYQDLFANHQDKLTDAGKQELPRKILDLSIRAQRAKPEDQRDWTRVNEIVRVILSSNNLKEPEKDLFQIQLLERQDKREEARKLAERASQRYPQIAQFPLILAELTPDHEQAMSILDRVQQTFGDSAIIRIARGGRLAQLSSANLEQQLLGLLENAERFPENEQLVLKQNIATLLNRAGYPLAAYKVWEQLLPAMTNKVGTYLLMFELAEAGNSLESMNVVMDGIAQEVGKQSAEWLVCEANRQLWRVKTKDRGTEDLTDILSILEKAKAERPEYAPIFAMEAEVQVLMGKPDRAAELLRTAATKRPGEISYQQRLADVYMMAGRTDDARRILQQLPASRKRTADIINEINALLQENPKLAVQRALEAFSVESNNVDELLLLVDVFRAVGEPERALPVVQRAVKMDMTQPRPWLLFAQTLAGMNRTEDVKKVVQQIKQHVPAEQQPLLLGQCYSTIREFDLAEEALTQALANQPQNTVILRNLALLQGARQQNDKLRQTLEQIVSVGNSGDAETARNVAWARRTLAQQLVATESYGDFLKAIAMLEQNAGPNGQLPEEDLTLWLKWHAERPEADSRRKVIERLDKLRAQRVLSSTENFVLAYVHYIEGRWDEAESLMQNVIAKNPDRQEFIATYIEWLIERNEVNDAQRWLSRLNQQSLQAVLFQSALMVKTNRATDAAKAIMARVPKEIDRATAVQLLESLGKYDERFYKLANQQWQQLVKESPGQITNYITFLTGVPDGGGIGELMQLLEPRFADAIQKKDSATTMFCIQTALTALRNNRSSIPTNSPHYARVKKWMDDARSANVGDALMVWSEVDYHDLQQDYDRLMQIYPQLLKRSDLSEMHRALVRNNLAFLYAISDQGSQALEVIGDAISQLGPRSDFLDTRGLAHLASGNIESALADLRKAVDGGQAASGTYFHLALAESRANNIPEAVAAMQQAIDKGLKEEELFGREAAMYQDLMKELKPHMPVETVE